VTSAIRHWPENVTFFGHKKPHTANLDRWNVAIHGQSYGEPQVTQDLSEKFSAPVAGAFNIGLLHTCLEDGTTTYAPARVDRLAAHGYEYWALGHIHQRQDFSRVGVHISFPGNSQGRSIRETGPKGCSLVTVEDDHTVTSQFEELDVVRWQELTIATDDAGLERDVREALECTVAKCEGRLLAVRLQLIGNLNSGQSLRDRLDGVAVEVGDVWLEKILVTPPARDSETSMTGALPPLVADEIQRIVETLQTDDSAVAEWMADFAELRGRFSGELGETEAMQALSEKQAFRDLLKKVGGQLA